ncbi:exported hypothetical protein [Burkholderiales bacterium]|jgi:hypothetical protein|nr:exported hypothetical protein [Burkholderiales bacterium]
MVSALDPSASNSLSGTPTLSAFLQTLASDLGASSSTTTSSVVQAGVLVNTSA